MNYNELKNSYYDLADEGQDTEENIKKLLEKAGADDITETFNGIKFIFEDKNYLIHKKSKIFKNIGPGPEKKIENEKYFMGKYFLKEFLDVNEELLNEPVRIEDYVSVVTKKINRKNINEIMDEIFESGSVLNPETPDLIDFLNKCIELCQKNGNGKPLILEKNTYGLVKAFIYETGHLIAINNGISTQDTITEYDFGKMLYEELKETEMTGFFAYEFEDLKKRLGL